MPICVLYILPSLKERYKRQNNKFGSDYTAHAPLYMIFTFSEKHDALTSTVDLSLLTLEVSANSLPKTQSEILKRLVTFDEDSRRLL